ncbi:AraC family transcriptional regulator [Phocaeicola sp.]|uniref:AraC family transcriptional regulator n=1 Tax=Phocaeicola sp. TaxID=2773926 RepID=UPI0023D020F6|nr:AraC family transcriptional regulator [Phocaeicola sp.]MDE5678634.1 AraC family transcriptional regulator [Phocaeicola sp.]
MAKIELGFEGERFIYIPNLQINLMEDSPLTNDLYIYSLGYFFHAAHHYINRPDGCNEFLFIYCKGGCGWIELYGKRQKLEPNQFIILPKDVPHSYWADEEDPWTIYWIHFRGSKASIFSKDFDRPTTVEPSALSRIEERLDLFEEIFFVLNESLSINHLHYANLCFAHFLASFLFIDVYRNKFRRKEYSENVIKRVIHYMNENIENNLKLKDLTLFSGYSESYLYRKFVKETGHAPMDYYMRLKMDKACKLLIQTDMKINQIACKLGFREPQYFSRTFSNIMGLSAKEFRQQNFRL